MHYITTTQCPKSTNQYTRAINEYYSFVWLAKQLTEMTYALWLVFNHGYLVPQKGLFSSAMAR